ncbi:MAG: class I SAM-dependent methyltransferase [Spirochaetaceae bacterium]|nr:class I SAM-dependent methyltransferase [Spirochaetaceae bacterium]
MFYTDFAEDYEKIFPFRENIYSFLKAYLPPQGKRILDIGCATGHYCGRFASEGYIPLGIDLDSQMIKSASTNYTSADFRILDLTKIDSIESEFDLIYSTGNVMAHISESDFLSFLKSIKRKMTKSGIWIFQVINWDFILTQQEFTFPVIETDSKSFHRKYTEIGEKELIFHTELTNRETGKSVFKDKVTMYPLPSYKYIDIHERAGFQLRGHFSDYSETPFFSSNFSADIYVFSL